MLTGRRGLIALALLGLGLLRSNHDSTSAHVDSSVHVVGLLIGSTLIRLLAFATTTLMGRIPLATVNNPSGTVGVGLGIGESAIVEPMRRADGGPVLLVLL